MVDIQKCSPEVVEYYKQYKNTGKLKQTLLNGSSFLIDEKYKIYQKIGQGAYGVVAAAIDLTAKEGQTKEFAIKKIEKAFDQRIYTKRTLRELKLLRLLKHENIVNLETIILPRSREEFDDIYCVSELMETDLAQILKTDQQLTSDHIRFFMYQLMRGLKYMHSGDVIHRDLKPRNLLVNSNCDLKICDFGLARTMINPQGKQKVDVLTDYVTTRWYRAPELILSWTDYNYEVDIWSAGLIFAEMIKRRPLIQGQSSSDQLLRIFDIIGTPTKQEAESIQYEDYKKFVLELPKKQPKQFDKLFPSASKEACDLLSKMLVFDFKKRITVQQVLEHPYLSDLHLLDDEPVRQKIPYLEFEFENYNNLTRQQYKDLVFEEILLYHNNEFKEQYLKNIKLGKSVTKHILDNQNKYLIDPKDNSDEEKQ